MEDYLLRVIQADNPWISGGPLEPWFAKYLPEKFIPRDISIEPGHRVLLVVGPRQAGKSTMIWKTLAEAGKPCLYLNCDEPAYRQGFTSPALFLDDLGKLLENPVPLFFEEIQRLPEAGLFLKGLVDRRPGVPIFATGSSSFHLESRTRESLSGRAVRRVLFPLSVYEIGKLLGGPELIRQKRLDESVQNMLRFGGYPTVFASAKPDKELASLVEAFVIRDASDRFRIRRPAAFRKVLELAASQIGNLCNYSEWAAVAGISNDTVSEYVHLMEETHIIRLVRPFVGGRRAELTRMPKVYFIDNGIRNLLFGGFEPAPGRPDRGALWENLAFSEILKSINPVLDSIRTWRTKAGAEVDFVIEHQGRIVACEVKAGDLRGRLTRSARSFIDAYQPELFLVVGSHPYPPRHIKTTEVRFIRLRELGGTIQAVT